MPEHPNILFVMTDQQHAGMLSCAGDRWLHTPAMDRLAREGVRFARSWCTNPVCVPSRISMATGMMPCRFGADDNANGMQAVLPPTVDAHSLGRIAKDAGYATFYGGKVHMCPQLRPERAGYDAVEPDEREALPAACLDFVTRRRAEPFFAVASFVNPHDICFAHKARSGVDQHGVLALHEEAAALPDDALPPLPDNHAVPEGEPPGIGAHASRTACTPEGVMRDEYDERDWRINRWIYRRLTEGVDALVGELLAGLDEAGLAGDTVVVFTSDHGNLDAAHRLASKAKPYEESVGVPLIVRHPDRIPAGRVDDAHLISTGLDLLPTCCDYLGVEVPPHCLGRSLRPLAEDRDAPDWRRYLVAENDWFRALRTGRWKYTVADDPAGGEFLVDLAADPGELRNLAGLSEHRAALTGHRRLLAEWVQLSADADGRAFLRDG